MQTVLKDKLKKKNLNILKIKQRQVFINNLIPYAVKEGNKNNGWLLKHEMELYYNQTYKKEEKSC